jgi:hypothetical protein
VPAAELVMSGRLTTRRGGVLIRDKNYMNGSCVVNGTAAEIVQEIKEIVDVTVNPCHEVSIAKI